MDPEQQRFEVEPTSLATIRIESRAEESQPTAEPPKGIGVEVRGAQLQVTRSCVRPVRGWNRRTAQLPMHISLAMAPRVNNI